MNRFADALSHLFSRCRFAAATVLLGAALPAHATNYHVGTGCTYTTIQAAITAAMAVSGSWPKIYISTNKTWSNQAISITPNVQSHVTLIGGMPDCGSTSSGNTTLNGGAGTSVITVRGAVSVTLSHLTISGGNDVIGGNDDEGGGIDYVGTGYMNIDNSSIFNNHAENGGGIRFKGNGGTADLYLNANTFVTNNTANATGGGIRAEDNASVHIDADQTWIAQNEATNGYGGGIAAVGNAYVHIGSPGYKIASYIGVVYGNTAQWGGGIAVISGSGGAAQADLFASDPANPVRIEQNRAYHTGGGIYLVPYEHFSTSAHVAVQLGGAQIDDNAAQEGSGIYADTVGINLGGDVYFYSGHCAAGVECNTVSNNRAVDGSDTATAGSAILIQSYGRLQAQQLAMRGNQGEHAIRVADSLGQPLLLDTCLIAGNTVNAELVTLGNASATINQCTIAYNSLGGTSVLRANADFALTNSIIAQGPFRTLFNADAGASMNLDYVISMETASLGGSGPHIFQYDPGFADPGNGDFHLRVNSPAIDKAAPVVGDDRDLDNRPRDQDLPEVLNLDGDRDLGAYERQRSACDVGDTVFCNGFDGL
jgi:hypothetical protein